MPSPTSRGRYFSTWVFASTLAVLIGGALTGYLNARSLIGNERLVAHSDDALVELSGLLSALREAERNQRGYLLTRRAEHLQGYRDATRRIDDDIGQLGRELRANPAQRARLAALRLDIARKLAELEQTISLEQRGEHAAAVAIVGGGASREVMAEIRARIAAMRAAEYALLDRRALQSERSSDLTMAAIVAPTLIGAALLGLLYFLNNRRMIELEDADRHKDEFLALLAHELRGPLAPLRNGIELVKQGDAADERHRRACALMERQLEQLVRLINDLLDAARVARGKIELRRTSIDLGVSIRDVVEAERPLAEAAGLTLAAVLPAEPLLVDGDAVRLAQVFRNLLHNARKYTERGGRIELSLAPEQGQAVVRVRDTGLGIPPAKLETIFEMFAQIEPGPARSQGGLGIGLALARRLLALHGGSVQAVSDGPGQGSEFVVRLPLLAEALGPPRPLVDLAGSGSARRAIG